MTNSLVLIYNLHLHLMFLTMIAGSVTFLSRLDLALYIGGESSSAYICKHAFFKLKGEKKIRSIERKSNVVPPHKKSDKEKHVKRKKDGDKRKSQ